MYSKIWVVIVCFVLIRAIPCVAQSNGPLIHPPAQIPPAPGAASLGQYGDLQTTCYTGTPNISVPLYSFPSKDFQLDLALNYNGSGIKVEEEATWVGLGWVLNAGGVVTRTIRGRDDLEDVAQGFPVEGPLWQPNGSFNSMITFMYIVGVGGIDPEPDIFYFSLPGASGKFVMNKGSSPGHPTPLLLEQGDTRIEMIRGPRPSNAVSPAITWVITTGNGVKYTYSTEQHQISGHASSYNAEIADCDAFPGANSSQPTTTTSWYLTRIESPNGEVIQFDYATSLNAGIDYNEVSLPMRTARRLFYHGSDTTPVPCEACHTTSTDPTYSSLVTVNEALYLKSIRSSTTAVEFLTTPRTDIKTLDSSIPAQKLSAIVIHDGPDITYPISKNLNFTYSYFNSGSTHFNSCLYTNSNVHNQRLKLTQVQEVGPDLSAKKPYSFRYEESTPLPRKDTFARDHWGYSNGQINNDNPQSMQYGLVSSSPQFFALDNVGATAGSNREPDVTPTNRFILAGTLNEITYPTGGKTQFVWEQHEYLSNPPTLTVRRGGGIRIQKIRSVGLAGELLSTKSYEYHNGRLMVKNIFYYMSNYETCSPNPNLGFFCTQLVVSSNSCITLGGSGMGNVVGYDNVSEIRGDNGVGGKTTYEYINTPDASQNSSIDNGTYDYIPELPTDPTASNGKPRNVWQYRKDNNTFVEAHRTSYRYDILNKIEVLVVEKPCFVCT